MKNFIVGSVATIALGLGSPALAADMPLKAPTIAETYNWSGFYLGLNAGYGFARAAPTSLDPNDVELQEVFPPNIPLPSTLSASGFVGGGQAGYNHQFGSVLAGLETDLSYAGFRTTASATGPDFIGGTLTTTVENKLDWFGTLRARLGVLTASNLLIYGTGGLAYGDVRTTTTGTNALTCTTHFFCVSGSTSGVSAGWTAGGGLEYAIAREWTIKAEYLYMDLGNRSVTFRDPNVHGGAFTANTGFTAQIVRAGLNYRF